MQLTMGRTLASVEGEKLSGEVLVAHEDLPPEAAPVLMIDDAWVETNATTLALLISITKRLGQTKRFEIRFTPCKENAAASVYNAVRETMPGRVCTVEEMQDPDGVPALLGEIPFEMTGLAVELQNRRLIPNPAQPSEHLFELLHLE